MFHQRNPARTQLDRRSLLRFGGASLLAVAAAPSLAACSSKGEAANNTTAAVAKLPTYQASTTAPKPDLAGNGSTVEPGYLTFPAKVGTAVPQKPGKGNTYSGCTIVFGPPVGKDNPQVKAVDEAMGAKIEYQQIPGDQYNAKVTAMLAGGQVPDLLCIPSWDRPARLNEGAKRVFADLNSKLAGDAILKYPNLAAIPTASWVGGVIDGVIRGVPIQAPQLSWCTFMRTDIVTAAGKQMPTSVEEMMEVCKAVNNPSKRRWAWWDPDQFVRRTYGLGHEWQTDESGTMRYYWEMPAWKDALSLYQRIYKAGYMHPEALNGGDKKAPFVAGNTIFLDDGFDAWRDWASPTLAKTSNSAFRVDALVPFSGTGEKPTVFCDFPWLTTTFLSSKLSSDQIDELLGLMNYLAAPFGTKENLLVTMGIEGRHWTMKDGVPTATKVGLDELRSQYYFTAQAPRTTVRYGEPEWVKRAHAWQEKVTPMAKMAPAAGLNVNIPAKLQAFQTKPLDAQKEFVRGRITMAQYDKVITNWQKQFGDQLRTLVQSAVDANK